ncbi:hypothetical protein BASA83_011968 [Batrachochytrium salamandrivorans]|nr:hypothetical protein BASA83_011968 [Batrachochytrium salamandrivorans]
MKQEHRVKQGLCLVCGEAGHQKVNCPKSRFKFNSIHRGTLRHPDGIHEQQTLGTNSVIFKETVKFRQTAFNFDNLNMDMMKTVDGGVHECDELDDVARGVLGRLENMLLLPGTLHFGSAIHADTFFIDCGADDVFMDAELADRLNIPLVKIPVPIKLRLADGDSSSMITHRTLPLQLHMADMLKQLVSMSPVSAMGLFLDILGWNTITLRLMGVQNGGFWIQLLFEELLCWVDSDSRSWKASKNLGYLAKA